MIPLLLIYKAGYPLCTAEHGAGVVSRPTVAEEGAGAGSAQIGLRCAADGVGAAPQTSAAPTRSPSLFQSLASTTQTRSVFMELQQQAWTSNLCQSYAQAAGAEAFASGQAGRSLGGYPFPAMNNSPLHNPYQHSSHHPYLTSYQSSVTSCPPSCPSPPRDGKCCSRRQSDTSHSSINVSHAVCMCVLLVIQLTTVTAICSH